MLLILETLYEACDFKGGATGVKGKRPLIYSISGAF
jgi:hypothetical protein